jgi:hypothetical protein
VDDRMPVEFIHSGHDAIFEFLFGCDADVAQNGAGELGKEPLDEIEPGAVLRSESEFEAARRLIGELSFSLLGDVHRMIVQDQLDHLMLRDWWTPLAEFFALMRKDELEAVAIESGVSFADGQAQGLLQERLGERHGTAVRAYGRSCGDSRRA